ncbi:MAG: Rpn family recombination-promoting nuclease/putative transposase [Deltaproteobacteria bacterium]|nr:MAG: Rpn family recombination-promoting nuclease/putative transposase [Deltaproteobacteria bacterium]
MQTERMSPKIDVVFEALFGNETSVPIVLDLLNTVLGREEGERLHSATLMPKSPQVRDADDDGSRLRWRVEDQRSKSWHVEVQCHNRWLVKEKVLLEWAESYATPWVSAENHSERLPTILVMFTDFPVLKEMDSVRTRWVWKAVGGDSWFSEQAQICLVELPKCKLTPETALSPLERWSLFLKEGDTLSGKALEAWADDYILLATETLEQLGNDATFRQAVEKRAQEIQDYLAGIRESYREGLKKGRRSEREVLAQKLLAKGFEMSEVADLTNMTEDELMDLF